MSVERNNHRTAIAFSAIAVIVALVAAFATTFERVGTRKVDNETPPGTMGLAKPHAPLDRAPDQPISGH
ncbi:hypothetical protein MTR72_19740 [Bradyrhizobium sp. ISRA442]|uniref:hypothetical protein n=1 Tax=Bradyrhizobium sp. ISRA442 TaxID=2866197 RepID=UPI00311AC09D